MNKKQEDNGKKQAGYHLDSIKEMVKALQEAQKKGDEKATEQAIEIITSDPLEVSIRDDWHAPGSEDKEATDFKILLCWGGPAVRIIGELDEYNQPNFASLEFQDWGTGWIEYPLIDDEMETVLEYCKQFYFEE